MANDLNMCQFIGRLGKDPEVRYMANGDAVANITLACGWKTKENEGTEWIRIVAFGRLAEIISEYLKKGDQAYILGRMQTRKWQDKDGGERYTTEVVAERLQMLGNKRAGSINEGAKAGQSGARGPAEDVDDDIPF